VDSGYYNTFATLAVCAITKILCQTPIQQRAFFHFEGALLSNTRFMIHENLNKQFGPVATWSIIIPEAVFTHGEELRVYTQSSSQSGFYRELYVHSYQAGGPIGFNKLLYVIDPNDEVPSLHKLTIYGSWVVFQDELYLHRTDWGGQGGVVRLSTEYLHPITEGEAAHYLQLFPRE
jgi:hypothetical protein